MEHVVEHAAPLLSLSSLSIFLSLYLSILSQPMFAQCSECNRLCGNEKQLEYHREKAHRSEN